MKLKFILFTKTPWDEPPRIRHQLARLLSAHGFPVYFFEKPLNWPKKLNHSVKKENDIQLIQYQELLHHKLRLNSLLHHINAIYTINSINKKLRGIDICENDIIVNFNYEYYFLRKVFPKNKIITIINDDFISRALLGCQAPLRWALKRCLKASNNVFTVSLPLQNDLKKYCTVELLMPWADRNYAEPQPYSKRNTLLFWGYINHRIDFQLIEEMLTSKILKEMCINIWFVGPINETYESVIERFKKNFENFMHQGSSHLAELNLDEVVAGIIPYRENDPTINAVTLSNKALQILARGLPLLISGMPNFINEPFVYRISKKNVGESVLALSDEFYSIQPIIKDYVTKNSGEARLKQLFNALSL